MQNSTLELAALQWKCKPYLTCHET